MASKPQFTEMFLEWPFSKIISQILINPWTWLWQMGAAEYYHYTNMNKFLKNSLLWNYWSDFEIVSLKCSLSDPFQKLLAKFWSINKHGISELLALYKHTEVLVNSSLKARKKKLARIISKIQVSDPGPSWPSCYNVRSDLALHPLLLYQKFLSQKKRIQ